MSMASSSGAAVDSGSRPGSTGDGSEPLSSFVVDGSLVEVADEDIRRDRGPLGCHFGECVGGFIVFS